MLAAVLHLANTMHNYLSFVEVAGDNDENPWVYGKKNDFYTAGESVMLIELR